ncbi:hypothetical protein [Aeromicrobium sp. CTD01-1L150]|uniref:hypothetical protein n=1 Tax=Aeromicrobium sp. CTD01-1L150 TaxID=3341830 RepID=UPI0035C18577
MRRRLRRVGPALAATALLLGACAVVPQERDDVDVVKEAVTPEEVDAVYERYQSVRATAARLLNAKPLSTVETGAVLDIDTGSFEVSQRLSSQEDADDVPVEVEEIIAPRFDAYPLWFVAVVRDPERDVNRVQLFERNGAADPWLLAASPETILDAELPPVRERDAAALVVAAEDGTGMAMSAQDAAETYAAVLQDPEAEPAEALAEDGFIDQMRTAARQNSELDGVEHSQEWEAEEVRHVLRTADGGALAFVDLSRSDTYEVEEGVTVTWPEDSPQQAFIPQGISTSGTLLYKHQVLVLIPGGEGKPRAIGQFGGAVGAEGF